MGNSFNKVIHYTCVVKLLPKKWEEIFTWCPQDAQVFLRNNGRHRNDYLHWQSDWQISRCCAQRPPHHATPLPFFSQQNCVRTTNPWLTAERYMVHMDVVRKGKLTVDLQKWTCRQSHSEWRTRWAWRWCLWKADGTRESRGGTWSPGTSGSSFPCRRRPPASPAGCSASSACTRCSAVCRICKCLQVENKSCVWYNILSSIFRLCFGWTVYI